MEKSVLFKLSSLNMQLQVNSQIPQRLLQLLRLESLLEFVTTCADGIKGLKVHHGNFWKLSLLAGNIFLELLITRGCYTEGLKVHQGQLWQISNYCR